MITGIGTAAVVVRDEKKAAEWYKDKLGFEIRDNDGHWVTVAPKGYSGLELHLCKTKPLEKGNTGILFQADNLDRTYEELTARGVKFTKKPKDEGWGKFAMFKDLDGNVFWLMQAWSS